MAVLRTDFYSDVLQLGTSMTVILPEPAATQIGTEAVQRPGPPPVLYLLHGLSDDDTMWLRQTSIHRYAAELGLAVVMPQVHRSFYADLPGTEGRYWTFLSQELPRVVGAFFNVSRRREDTFVAGLSMGGYGALKWALSQPERFAAAASLSGAVDLQALADLGERRDLIDGILGGRSVAEVGDVFRLADAVDPAAAPDLFVACGTEDVRLIDQNRRLVEHLERRGMRPRVDFGPGEHEWGYWDRTIQDVLAWLPIDRAA